MAWRQRSMKNIAIMAKSGINGESGEYRQAHGVAKGVAAKTEEM